MKRLTIKWDTVVRALKTKRTKKLSRPIRDPEVTQKQILDAAELEFARHGLKGARMSAIANCAEVTTAALYYYFESKEGLYKAVLQRPVDEVQAMVAQLKIEALGPEDALKEIVRCTITYEASNPHRQMLWFQEASQNQGLYFKESNVWNLHEHLLKVLERGMAAGYFRQLDPFLALTHILSVCMFYFTVHENWKHLTPDTDRLSSKMLQKHTEAAIEFVLAGVRKTQ